MVTPQGVPPRTPGALGTRDAADPDLATRRGDTPGPLGHQDGAESTAEAGPAQMLAADCPVPQELGRLEHFPVRYPDGFTARPPARGEHHRVTWQAAGSAADGSVAIWFGNSFENDRHGTSHGAIDIHGPIGCPIVLTTRQQVFNMWRNGGRPTSGVTHADAAAGSPEFGGDGGNAVRAIDDRGFVHYYCHLQDHPRVTPGGVYPAGTVIGYLGNTGNAGVAHLHYQVKTPRLLRAGPDSSYGMALLTSAGLCIYEGRGQNNVDTYQNLVTLAQGFRPPAIRRGPNSNQYILQPGATAP
jgi:murein DD-endopeptidase MepM/ murein hydrolase activator NlpD